MKRITRRTMKCPECYAVLTLLDDHHTYKYKFEKEYYECPVCNRIKILHTQYGDKGLVTSQKWKD